MNGCHLCGESTNKNGPPYRCAYCGELVCQEHRLPENHNCTGERLPEDESPIGKGPEPMDLSEQSLPGKTPESKHGKTGSSPDVALDGSIKSAERKEDDQESADTPWWKRFLPW
jgi:hypothetical protein